MGTHTWSEAERVEACPTSAVLPRVLESSDDADRGSAIHRFLRNRIVGVDEQHALAQAPTALRDTLSRINLKWLLAGLRDVRAEVAYQVDVERSDVVELGVDLERRYPTSANYALPGTLDVEGARAIDDVPVVGDWKTGFRDVTACAENPQIMAAARARQLVTGADVVEGRIWYVRPSGWVEVDSATFTRYDLEGWEMRQVAAVDRVLQVRVALSRKRRLTVATGDWCRYCPGKTACPAFTGLAKRMLPELASIKKSLVAMTLPQVGEAFLKAKTIVAMAEEVIEGCKEIAIAATAVPTTPGKELRQVAYEKSYFRKNRAVTLLEDLHVPASMIAACSETVVETSVREVKAR